MRMENTTQLLESTQPEKLNKKQKQNPMASTEARTIKSRMIPALISYLNRHWKNFNGGEITFACLRFKKKKKKKRRERKKERKKKERKKKEKRRKKKEKEMHSPSSQQATIM